MAAVEFRNIDIVFGADQKGALKLIDEGRTRDEILAATGTVLGAAGVSLAVERGEICVLMGLSGSGKSTILRAINRLNEVARGEVLVEHNGAAIDVAHCDEATLRDIRMHTVSMVFQQFGLLPWRTVRDNVGFGLELRGMGAAERNRIVDEKLAMVGLTNWAGKYTSELSGGMQQRVGLARAFATDAEILLMDEPFSALDPLIRDKLQDELLDLQRRIHKTIVFVSHDLDEALKLGNKIAIMEGGRIVQAGTAEDILLRPANDYVAEFVKHMNPLNVLRGTAVMRPAASLAREGDSVVLDRDGRVKVKVDPEGRPLSLDLDGRAGVLATADGEAGVIDDKLAHDADCIVAPVDLKLKAAIELKRHTDLPILLVDSLGRLAGLCDDDEIYRGLLRRLDG
ncbi:choline ABC transporter ATP-binding protein [Ancylobacter dichloromethanicus]|uniref:Trimethylamine N-oxide transport system ATP-binding protein TmoW n=1 Tax=Ancylobacter dichloromethanicus TaxID=518825 RepID=A0A9W6J717_9HYPH|nr:choline ABC transporter ATP-binding protein [Ancylobacter dichloromethanicus]MBS7555326.1 choline ABC transporter ATP-binding protein [Ancylobacter dichloromethanicus]GLK70508.1 choline ABC transporter ATP-binding protein [Ancylobacter dichloromethanicus]